MPARHGLVPSPGFSINIIVKKLQRHWKAYTPFPLVKLFDHVDRRRSYILAFPSHRPHDASSDGAPHTAHIDQSPQLHPRGLHIFPSSFHSTAFPFPYHTPYAALHPRCRISLRYLLYMATHLPIVNHPLIESPTNDNTCSIRLASPRYHGTVSWVK